MLSSLESPLLLHLNRQCFDFVVSRQQKRPPLCFPIRSLSPNSAMTESSKRKELTTAVVSQKGRPRRDSNPQPSVPKTDALPLSHSITDTWSEFYVHEPIMMPNRSLLATHQRRTSCVHVVSDPLQGPSFFQSEQTLPKADTVCTGFHSPR